MHTRQIDEPLTTTKTVVNSRILREEKHREKAAQKEKKEKGPVGRQTQTLPSNVNTIGSIVRIFKVTPARRKTMLRTPPSPDLANPNIRVFTRRSHAMRYKRQSARKWYH